MSARSLKWLATVVVLSLIAALAVGVAMAPVAISMAQDSSRQDEAGDGAASVGAVAVRAPTGFGYEGLLEFPIVDPEGEVAKAFPDGAGLDDEARVDEVVTALLGRLGFGERAAAVLRYSEELGAEVAAEIDEARAAGVQLGSGTNYPYTFSSLDTLIREEMTKAEVEAHPEVVVDTASLLLLHPQMGAYSSTASPETVAYTLLTVALDIHPTCEMQLNLAFYLSLGQHAPLHAVRQEVEKAIDLCGDDPTPLWLLGTFAAGQSSVGFSLLQSGYSPGELTDAALGAFARLRDEYPDSPLGWAGAADLWLDLADEAEDMGTKPFSVRKWRRQALAFYEQARSRSSATGLLAGHARALSAVGRSVEAADLALELVRADSAWAPYQALLVDILVRARDFQGVVEVQVENQPDSIVPAARIAVGSPYGFGLRGRAVPYPRDPSWDGVGGAGISDRAFIPEFEREWARTGEVEDAYVAALIASGDPDGALQLIESFRSECTEDWEVETASSTCLNWSSKTPLELVAAAESENGRGREWAIPDYGETVVDDSAFSKSWDHWQDFWRWAGDKREAAAVTSRWQEALPGDPWAHQRLGELKFVAKDYSAAAEEFSMAVDLFGALRSDTWRDISWGGGYNSSPDDHRRLAQLQLGAAREMMDSPAKASRAFTDASSTPEANGISAWIAIKAQGQAGASALSRGRYDEAFKHLREAVRAGEEEDGEARTSAGNHEILPEGPLHGAEHNNLALAAAKTSRFGIARRAAAQAIERDPANPVYWDTLAFVHHLAGDDTEAVDAYSGALAEDESSYVSANNLAVLLAERGEEQKAEDLLEQAVAVAPSYALAWHNLGVVRSRADTLASFLSAQGALARAASIDRSLKGDQAKLRVDEKIYDSGVDISRPVPADWTYAQSATEPSRRFALTMLVLVLIRVLWALGLDRFGGWITRKVVASRPSQAPRLSWFWRRTTVAWPLAVTTLLLAVPAARGLPTWPSVMIVAAVTLLAAAPLAVRALTQTPREMRHFGWMPAMAFGIGGAPLGVSFAPYPALDDRGRDITWVQRWAPALAATAIVLVVTTASAFTAVPYLRTIAMASLVLLASILLPTPPFDGSHIKGRLAQLAVAGGLATMSLGFVMKWF